METSAGNSHQPFKKLRRLDKELNQALLPYYQDSVSDSPFVPFNKQKCCKPVHVSFLSLHDNVLPPLALYHQAPRKEPHHDHDNVHNLVKPSVTNLRPVTHYNHATHLAQVDLVPLKTYHDSPSPDNCSYLDHNLAPLDPHQNSPSPDSRSISDHKLTVLDPNHDLYPESMFDYNTNPAVSVSPPPAAYVNLH